jgi:hypothetical protein
MTAEEMKARLAALTQEIGFLRDEIEALNFGLMLQRGRDHGAEADRLPRVEVDRNDDTSVIVRAGRWARNGVECAVAETRLDGFSGASQTYTVYLELTGETPGTAPTGCEAKMALVAPTDGPQHVYRRLAEVLTTAGGKIGEVRLLDKGDSEDSVLVESDDEFDNLREAATGGSGFQEWRRWGVADQGSGTVRVTVGAWTRNGTTVTLTPDVGETYKTLAGCGSGDYVYAQLEGSTNDPALIPAEVKVYSSETDPRGDAEVEGLVWVLGKFESSVWEQWWKGGDIDDWVEVPDAERNSSGSADRSTLQRNPESGAHENELQLYDVHNAQRDAMSVPAFSCAQASSSGVLLWAAVDTNRDVSSGGSASQRSLEILEESVGDPPVTTRTLQLYGVDEADHTQVVRVSDVDGLKQLEYVWLIRFESDPCVGAAEETDLLDADGFGLSANGTELTLAFKKRTYEVVDGQSNLEGAVADSSVVDLADLLNGWWEGLGGWDGSLEVVVDVDFGTETVTKKVLTFSYGRLVSVEDPP